MQDVRWIPTDVAAEALLSILTHDAKARLSGVVVRHLDAPHALSGHKLVQFIVNASGGIIQPVAVNEWLNAVKDAHSKEVPATRLLQFYEEWLNAESGVKSARRPLSISNTEAICDLGQRVFIDPALITRYFVYATSGF